MAKLIFSVFFGIISSVTNIVLTPINAIVVGLFPNLSGILTTFNNAILIFASSPIGFFAYLLPPTTRSLVLLWLTLLIAYYSVLFTIHVVLKVFRIIKTIKFW